MRKIRIRDAYETMVAGRVAVVRGWWRQPTFHDDGRVTCKWRGKDRAVRAERNEIVDRPDGKVRFWFSFDWAE